MTLAEGLILTRNCGKYALASEGSVFYTGSAICGGACLQQYEEGPTGSARCSRNEAGDFSTDRHEECGLDDLHACRAFDQFDFIAIGGINEDKPAAG